MTEKLHKPGGPAELMPSFALNDRGNVAIIFAFALPILVGVTGAAIELGRASALRAALQQAADTTSASLTEKFVECGDTEPSKNLVARRCKTTIDKMPSARGLAQQILTENFRQQGYSHRPEITAIPAFNSASGRIEVAAQVHYACVFMKLIAQECDIASSAGAGSPLSRHTDTLRIGLASGKWRALL
jgi:hypothetical protein